VFTAAILAGGQARRLGGIDKGGLRVGSDTILASQLALLRPLTPHILIVANDMTRFADAAVPVVPDTVAGAGALGGLHSALVHAPVDPVLVIACDMPFLTAPFLTQLVDALGDADAVVPRTLRGQHPLCAVYARRVAPRLLRRIESRRLRVLDAIDELSVHEFGPEALASLDPEGRLLVNVNTPDDYRDARARVTHAAD
jgi:molybdopterin-guanine dinucleotide biosynthesis protein A